MSEKLFFLGEHRLQAVIFDFDGVLGDTVSDNFRAWRKSFALFGIKVSKQEYSLLEGFGPLQIAQALAKKHKLSLKNVPEIAEAKAKFYTLQNRFRMFPDAVKLVLFLKRQNIPMAIVTGALSGRFNETFPKKILAHFKVVITSDKLSKPKPHPQGYRMAAAKLEIDTKACLVIENAPLGIKSAKAAGCICAAVTTSLQGKYLRQADVIAKNLETLKSKLIFL